MLDPFQLVMPNLITSYIGLIGALHCPFEGFKVVSVKLRVTKAFCSFFNERIVVIYFLKIYVILAGLRIGGDELATDGFMYFTQNRLDLGKQIISRNTTELLYPR